MLKSNYEEQARKVLEKHGYQTIRKIGKGGFGHVVLTSKFQTSMNFYAVKCFHLKSSTKDGNSKKHIEQQISIMCNVQHSNLVKYETSFQDSGWYFIVMEYCDKGNLTQYQSKMADKLISFREAVSLMIQILAGVDMLHSHNIIHRDIKTDNIFLKKNKNGLFLCKIGDFGFAKQIDDYTKTSCGTTLFMAPEVLRKMPYSYQADIWSLGVVFYFLLFGQYPFKSLNIEKQIFEKCSNGYSLSNPLHKDMRYSIHLQQFFRQVFTLDQSTRLTLPEMMNHSVFKADSFPVEEVESCMDDEQEEELNWCLAKVKFIEDVVMDITNAKFLDHWILVAVRFYLFKVVGSLLRDNSIMGVRSRFPNARIVKDIVAKEQSLATSLAKEYQLLQKYPNQTKKISNFSQGFNLELQDFYSMKQGYRNTLSMVYSNAQKKMKDQSTKTQLKLRILCCHLINRVFNSGLKPDVFPNFNQWVKKNSSTQAVKKDSKREYLVKLGLWMQVQSAEKLGNQIEFINKKFY